MDAAHPGLNDAPYLSYHHQHVFRWNNAPIQRIYH